MRSGGMYCKELLCDGLVLTALPSLLEQVSVVEEYANNSQFIPTHYEETAVYWKPGSDCVSVYEKLTQNSQREAAGNMLFVCPTASLGYLRLTKFKTTP